MDAAAEPGAVRARRGVARRRRPRVDREVAGRGERRPRGDRQRRRGRQRRGRVRAADRDEAAAAVGRDRGDVAAVVGADDHVETGEHRTGADRVGQPRVDRCGRAGRLDVDEAAARARPGGGDDQVARRRARERVARADAVEALRPVAGGREVQHQLLLAAAGRGEVHALDGEGVRTARRGRRCGCRAPRRRASGRAGSCPRSRCARSTPGRRPAASGTGRRPARRRWRARSNA